MSTGESLRAPDGGSVPSLEAEIGRLANQLFATPDLSGALASLGTLHDAASAPAAPPGIDPGAGVASPMATAPTAIPGVGLLSLTSPLDHQAAAPAAPAAPSPVAPTQAASPSASLDPLQAGFASPDRVEVWPTRFDLPTEAPGALTFGLLDERGAPGGDALERPLEVPYFLELVRAEPAQGARGSRESATVATPFEVRTDAVPGLTQPPSLLDPYAVRRDFPILEERVNGKRLVWLDNAATTQKPRAVIDRLAYFYEHENSNVHRAAHTLAARATDAYEGAREKVRRFLNAGSAKEIVFVRGATEGVNLVAQSWGRRNVKSGDEIIITNLEHHANIVPWQMLCAEKGARLRVAPVDSTGQVILEEYDKLLGPATRLVAFTHVSNALGTITPAREMIAMAHRHGAHVLLDGAQSASHMPVDVQSLDCDFFVFSGHKIFAPTGIGAVFGKSDVLAAMPPWQGGGNMIADVTFERTLYQPPPWRFEAGTGNIADAVGLGAALDYVESLGRPNIDRYEHDLRVYAEGCLSTIPGLRIIGTAREKAGVISFVLDGVPTEQIGGVLDRDGIAVRSGHHCAQPILRRFGLEATVRASLAPYNTRADVEALTAAVRRIQAGVRA
jgi:cysteine desulfurase/selenocysteine lyase